MRRIAKYIHAFFFGIAICIMAAAEVPVPQMQDRVTDLAGVFSAIQRNELITLLAEYENKTAHQIVVLTVPALNGETMESFSLRIATNWAVGHKGLDNGIVVILSPHDRRVRIELGRGFAPHFSNQSATAIIQSRMLPAFRTGNYAGGLTDGVKAVMVEGQKYFIPMNIKPSKKASKATISLHTGVPRRAALRSVSVAA